MKQKPLYSTKIKNIIKIISLFASFILIISNTTKLIQFGFSGLLKNIYEIISFIENIIIIVLFVLVIFHPEKIAIFSLISFYYGVSILIYEPKNNISILMYCLSILSLYARGWFNKKRRIKNITAIVILFGAILSEIRFGINIFIPAFINHLAYLFTFYCCMFFLYAYIQDFFETIAMNKKLDIQNYPKLKERDAEWLIKILNGEKYEKISIEYNMSLGSVKNRFKIIFDELKVGDKQGFINKFSDFEICYGEEISSVK